MSRSAQRMSQALDHYQDEVCTPEGHLHGRTGRLDCFLRMHAAMVAATGGQK